MLAAMSSHVYIDAHTYAVSPHCVDVRHLQLAWKLSQHMFAQVVQQLPKAWRLLLLTFGSSVAIYQLASKGIITADVVSGHWQASSKQNSSLSLPFGSAEPLHTAALQSCQEQAVAIINSWR